MSSLVGNKSRLQGTPRLFRVAPREASTWSEINAVRPHRPKGPPWRFDPARTLSVAGLADSWLVPVEAVRAALGRYGVTEPLSYQWMFSPGGISLLDEMHALKVEARRRRREKKRGNHVA